MHACMHDVGVAYTYLHRVFMMLSSAMDGRTGLGYIYLPTQRAWPRLDRIELNWFEFEPNRIESNRIESDSIDLT